MQIQTKEINVLNYYGGLSSISTEFQYTYYTHTINDIYLNLSIPTGYFPMFYFRNNLDNSISEGYFDLSGGIKSSFISDPVIINYGIGFSFNFKTLFLYDEGDDFYCRVGFNGNFGYTEVLNYILSYFIDLKFYFNLPEYKGLFLIKDKEVYSFLLYLKFGASINLDENSAFILSLSNSLTDGILNPYFDLYFSFKIK